MIDSDRYLRQRRVQEIGDSGQARLLAATVILALPSSGGAASRDVAACYLTRAGIRVMAGEELPARVFPHGQFFSHTATRDLAEGSWLALTEIRKALGPSAGIVE